MMSSQAKNFSMFLLAVAVFAILSIWFNPKEADTVFVNGRVYTMDAENSVVEAFAVKDDRISGIGTSSAIERSFKGKLRIDLQGKTVLPGFIDAHAHFMSLGISGLTVDLVGSSSELDAAERVKQRVAKTTAAQWIRGRGWDQNDWPVTRFPSRTSLDKISPNNPVFLVRVDGHAAWVNKKTLEIAGITRTTPDPPGGKIIRDLQGNPTGVFVDAAMDLVSKHLPELSDQEATEAIQLALRECLRYGITTVHDMGVDARDIALYKQLIEKGEFPFRIYAAIGGVGDLWSQFLRSGPLIGFGQNRLTVRALKLYIDGALGSRGAALIEPYSDEPDNRGLTVSSEEAIRSATVEALKHAFQVCTHAIGDRGNNIVLNMYEAALREVPVTNHRLRVEHAQVLYPDDIPKFKRSGIVPSMQPTHCTSDMYWAEARLGPKRILGAYAWRSLLKTGVVIPGGSDFPVEHPNPIFGIYAAVTRKDKEGRPLTVEDGLKYFQFSNQGLTDSSSFLNGWHADQKMTREEALRSFTTWGAWAGFEEHLKGSIQKGFLADFILLSADIASVPEQSILDIRVLKTYVGGKEVFGER
jgi:predicted amidohydrolase YtcJ